MRLEPGMRVRKVNGYDFDAVILATFTTTAGVTRLVCESTLIPGLVHIFAPHQMVEVSDSSD